MNAFWILSERCYKALTLRSLFVWLSLKKFLRCQPWLKRFRDCDFRTTAECGYAKFDVKLGRRSQLLLIFLSKILNIYSIQVKNFNPISFLLSTPIYRIQNNKIKFFSGYDKKIRREARWGGEVIRKPGGLNVPDWTGKNTGPVLPPGAFLFFAGIPNLTYTTPWYQLIPL